LRDFFLLLIYSTNLLAQEGSISNYTNPKAQGTLLLQIRNDTIKYVCENLKVENGSVFLCDSNPIIYYDYFIKRNEIKKDWLNNVLRGYDYFIEVKKSEESGAWLNFEKKLNISYKEDFTSDNQITGITYKHHESRRSLIYYTIANPESKMFKDATKYQYQYDWDENIKGRFESFYYNGIKKFRHKYEINRMMTMDKGINGLKKSSVDAQVTGTIQEYYSNGKKKTVVTYQDQFFSEKLNTDAVSKLKQSSRNGEKITYRENGRMYSKESFNNKGLNGKFEYYGPKGLTVIKVEFYKNGILDGKFAEYYLDGSIKAKGEYKNGKKTGVWVKFGEDGKKSESIKID